MIVDHDMTGEEHWICLPADNVFKLGREVYKAGKLLYRIARFVP